MSPTVTIRCNHIYFEQFSLPSGADSPDCVAVRHAWEAGALAYAEAHGFQYECNIGVGHEKYIRATVAGSTVAHAKNIGDEVIAAGNAAADAEADRLCWEYLPQSLTIHVEKAMDNFSAYADEAPGCIATGDTIAKTLELLGQALELHWA
jgi:hypothetical protein